MGFAMPKATFQGHQLAGEIQPRRLWTLGRRIYGLVRLRCGWEHGEWCILGVAIVRARGVNGAPRQLGASR